MTRGKSFVRAFVIVFVSTFALALLAGVFRKTEVVSWSLVIKIGAATATALGFLVAFRLDEGRNARLQAAVMSQVMRGQTPGVWVDEQGRIIPEDD